MNIIFVLILILIYLIGTIKIKKEFYVSIPSELQITVSENFAQYENNSDIIISKKDYNNNNYFKHNNSIINIKNCHKDEYNYNYKYDKRLYYYDFRWNLVTIFSFNNNIIPNNQWLLHNISKTNTLYKIIYIHEDKANQYNRKIFPHLKYGLTILIQGINPYHRYNIGNNFIISSREVNSKLIKKKNTKNAYIKFYMDLHKLVCIVKEDNNIIDKFSMDTDLDKIDYKKIENKINETVKEIPPDYQINGLVSPPNFFHKWHDPIFKEWSIFFIKSVNEKLTIDFNQYPMPTNYLIYLYFFNINYTEQYTFDKMINQFILDMQLNQYVKPGIDIFSNNETNETNKTNETTENNETNEITETNENIN